MSDLGDLAVFHGLFQLLILFKNSPFFEGRKKTSPCNRVTKKQLKKRKKYLTKKRTPGINTADKQLDKRSTGCCCSHTKALLKVRPCVNAEDAQRTQK